MQPLEPHGNVQHCGPYKQPSSALALEGQSAHPAQAASFQTSKNFQNLNLHLNAAGAVTLEISKSAPSLHSFIREMVADLQLDLSPHPARFQLAKAD